ncbi:MAG TPA: 3-deoxy-manno-octulosonate cytidylyltransferase [Candidatus Eisenbacteria bacterium]
MSVLAVIPARWASTRFPGKPLALLWGRPLIQHVWERAREVGGLDALVVATDDERIERAARGFGAEVERTSPACASGTDRVAEVARCRPAADLVVNLQGDEPELDPAAVTRLVAGMRAQPAIRMATLAHAEPDAAVLAAADVVKVGVDAEGFALYFTREAPAAGARPGAMLRHVGVYGFARELLLEFAAWPPGPLEREARLEQLRALEHGVRIRVFEAANAAAGIDTPEQLAALERRGPRAGRAPAPGRAQGG